MPSGSTLFDLFVSAFVTLFVVIDAPGCVPIYAGLTRGAGEAQRRAMAVRAVLIASTILLIFAIFGKQMLRALAIELDSFRLAGGIMLFLIALEMVFDKRSQRREERAQSIAKVQEAKSPPVEDISVFPMALPMIAGPGSITSVMLLIGHAEGTPARLTVLAALLANMAVMLAALIAAGPIIRLLGDRIEAVATRVLGVLLAALAAQFVIDGLRGSFGL